MSELAERVSRLRARLWTKIGFDTNDQDFTQRYAKLIEQALLAERRLAMEEAAKIAEDGHGDHGIDDCWCNETATKLRKLATSRGGE